MATSLVEVIKRFKRIHDPKLLFIEPSEMVVTQELRNVAAMGRRDAYYQIGPLITLVDASRFDFMWAERQQLIQGQINGADIVALSHTDGLEDSPPEKISKVLQPYCNGIDLLSVQDTVSTEKMIKNVFEFKAL